MSAILVIAGKEIQDGLRNRWIASAIVLLTTISLALYFLGSAPGGSIRASSLDVTVVSLASLSVYLIPLIALMLSYDTLVGEFERGTMLLLLTYPLARWQVVIGKFCGHMMILLSAIVIGYGATALVIAVTGNDVENWQAYLMMMASSWMLGGVFIALGYTISVFVQERATAAGAAIGVWLIGVVLYDLGLMGLLLADQEQRIGEGLFSTLIIANPTDAYRIFNLTGFESTRQVAGLSDIGANAAVNPGLLLAVMAVWLLVPLVVTILRFRKREL